MKKLFSILSIVVMLGQAHGEDPDRLISLRDSYSREIDRVTKPVTRKYLEALRDMQRVYTEGGDLEAALSVKAEIDTITENGDSAEIPIGEEAFGDWIRSVSLEEPTGKRHTVLEDFVAVEPGPGKRFTYRIMEVNEQRRTVVYAFPTGATISLKLSPNRQTGTLLYEDGNEIPLKVVSKPEE